MNSFSQFQNRTYHHLNSELHNTQRNNTYNTEKNHTDHEYFINKKMLAKNNLNNQSMQSEINQELLLKEIKLKNQILNAQLEEYKLLVINMQKKVGQLRSENKELNEKIIELSKFNQMNTKLQKDQKESLIQTVPIHNMFKQQKSLITSMGCYQIQQILTKFQPSIFTTLLTKREVEKQLFKMVQQKHQMQNFINSLWQLKDKIEPGNQQYLYQLWEWLKILAINYSQLKHYKTSKDQKCNKKEKN